MGSRRPIGLAAWSPNEESAALVRQVQEVLVEYQQHLPLTGRQVFYRLVGRYHYDKTEKAYKFLLERLVRARRAELIPWEAIRDDGVTTRHAMGASALPDLKARLQSTARFFAFHRALGQPYHVELWVEAAGMVPQMERVARDFGADVLSAGGFNSVTMKHDAAQRFIRRLDEGQEVVLLHVGDHDPSGVSIFDNLCDDVSMFAYDYGYPEASERLHFVRVAVTAEQAEERGLESSPPKASDSRSARWEGETYQAEALPPDDLAAIVREELARWQDDDILAALLEREEEARARMIEVVQSLDLSPLDGLDVEDEEDS